MHQLNSILQQALYLVVLTSAPAVVMALVVGLIVAVFQATTQIQEQTLSFAPKLITVFLLLALMGPWMGSQFARFTILIFEQFPVLIR